MVRQQYNPRRDERPLSLGASERCAEALYGCPGGQNPPALERHNGKEIAPSATPPTPIPTHGKQLTTLSPIVKHNTLPAEW